MSGDLDLRQVEENKSRHRQCKTYTLTCQWQFLLVCHNFGGAHFSDGLIPNTDMHSLINACYDPCDMFKTLSASVCYSFLNYLFNRVAFQIFSFYDHFPQTQHIRLSFTANCIWNKVAKKHVLCVGNKRILFTSNLAGFMCVCYLIGFKTTDFLYDDKVVQKPWKGMSSHAFNVCHWHNVRWVCVYKRCARNSSYILNPH